MVDSVFDNEIVSVIIPVYNSEKHIKKTIESVLNQTYKSFEIILVDDCSSDNSEHIINIFLREHKNITYFRLKQNSGAAVARNKALELANGRYIAFLDSDDLWYTNKLEKQLKLMKKKDAAICYTAIEMIDENGKLIKGKRNVLESVDYKFLLKNTMLATSTIIVDRNITGNFNMPLIRSGQDYATWLQLLRNGTIAYGINEVFVKYRKSSDSLSSNKFKSVKQVLNIQIKNENIPKLNALFNAFCFSVNAFKKHFI
jgi:teichuronic acid biosynthesis glycosyltransferase TuaG